MRISDIIEVFWRWGLWWLNLRDERFLKNNDNYAIFWRKIRNYGEEKKLLIFEFVSKEKMKKGNVMVSIAWYCFFLNVEFSTNFQFFWEFIFSKISNFFLRIIIWEEYFVNFEKKDAMWAKVKEKKRTYDWIAVAGKMKRTMQCTSFGFIFYLVGSLLFLQEEKVRFLLNPVWLRWSILGRYFFLLVSFSFFHVYNNSRLITIFCALFVFFRLYVNLRFRRCFVFRIYCFFRMCTNVLGYESDVRLLWDRSWRLYE